MNYAYLQQTADRGTTTTALDSRRRMFDLLAVWLKI